MSVEPREGTPGRRAVLKTAAWAAPVVALAAASPLAAASGVPECPDCLRAASSIAQGYTGEATVVNNVGTLVMTGGLRLDATTCPLNLFEPAYIGTITSAVITMSNGATYSGVGLGPVAGTLGTAGGLGVGLSFSGIPYPNGSYNTNTALGPRSITFTLLAEFIGLGGIQVTCPVTLTWNLSRLTTLGTVQNVPLVGPGRGIVTYTGLATAA